MSIQQTNKNIKNNNKYNPNENKPLEQDDSMFNSGKKCLADFDANTKIYPILQKNNMIDVVSFAPFLMWNEHDNHYFENMGTINKMAISDNNAYDTEKTLTYDDNYADLMREAYFSSENMDIIQNMMIKEVFYKSNQTLRINKIKNETLIQVMNDIWTKFCRFLPYDYKKQIYDLNVKVTEHIVPLLLNESKFYFNYLRDSDRTNRKPLERPIMISKGRKQQLPSFYK
jgi:hypothetical protein